MAIDDDTPPDPHYHPPVHEEGAAAKGARYGCGCMSVIMLISVIPAFVEAASSRRIFSESPDPLTSMGMATGVAVLSLVASVVAVLIYKRVFAKHFSVKVLIVSLLLTLTCSAITTVSKLMGPDHDKAQKEYEDDFDDTLKNLFPDADKRR